MDVINSENSTQAERLNYFNYFTEVEEEFVRRRGKPLLISPMDWALIESWKIAGIPLHIVLRAINSSFDSYDARPRKYRKVNSVFYCQQEVESLFSEYRLAQVGAARGDAASQAEKAAASTAASSAPAPPFSKQTLLDFLSRSVAELSEAARLASDCDRSVMQDAIKRAQARLTEIISEVEGSARFNAEAIERDLDAIDRVIVESAAATCGSVEIEAMRAEAESQLYPYRNKMDKTIYEQTMQNFIRRRLREMNQVPRLSLFYM